MSQNWPQSFLQIVQVDDERRIFDVEDGLRRVLDPVLEDVVALEKVKDLIDRRIPGNGGGGSDKNQWRHDEVDN